LAGRIDIARLRMALTGLELPRGADRQVRIAIDVTPWPRPDAETSAERLHCHRYCRCDGVRQTIAGWPYSVAAAIGSGRSSWTAPLDVVRVGPDDDVTDVTAAGDPRSDPPIAPGRSTPARRSAGADRAGRRIRRGAFDLVAG
jgi:hypothetical protein